MIWLVKGIIIILASFVIGVVVGRAIKWANGEEDQ